MSTIYHEVDEQVKELNTKYQYMIHFETLPNNIKNDIKEMCQENNCNWQIENEYIALSEVLEMYLKWNGIMGYTHNILSIFEHSVQCEIKD